MLKTTKKLIEEIHELEDFMVKELGKDMFENMDPTGFVALKKCFKLMKTSEEVVLKQAEMMESMNEKLDRLLEGKES